MSKSKHWIKKRVLFLHEKEEHELSLLFYYYILKKRGYDCYYLGSKVPINDLQQSVEQIKPDILITNFITKINRKTITSLLNSIQDFFDLKNIKIGGHQTQVSEEYLPSDIQVINSLNDLY